MRVIVTNFSLCNAYRKDFQSLIVDFKEGYTWDNLTEDINGNVSNLDYVINSSMQLGKQGLMPNKYKIEEIIENNKNQIWLIFSKEGVIHNTETTIFRVPHSK